MQVGEVHATADAGTEPPEEPRVRLAVLTTLLAGVALVLALTVQGEAARLHILSAFLLLLAVAEGFYGILHLFRPQQFATGPPNIYARQHFGLYNLFAALLYVIAALDPVKYTAVILAVICLYVLHVGYELTCSTGMAPLGKPPFRTRKAFLVDGLTLLGVIFPIALFLSFTLGA